MSLDSFRRHFRQTTGNGVFFDNASMGPVAPQVTRAMTQCMELRQAMPMKYYRYAQELFPQCRARLARMIGGTAEEIAFTENVTYGINSAALSLPLSPGDNVLLCDREFGSNVYPWLRLQKEKGVEARIVPNDGGGLTLPPPRGRPEPGPPRPAAAGPARSLPAMSSALRRGAVRGGRRAGPGGAGAGRSGPGVLPLQKAAGERG